MESLTVGHECEPVVQQVAETDTALRRTCAQEKTRVFSACLALALFVTYLSAVNLNRTCPRLCFWITFWALL